MLKIDLEGKIALVTGGSRGIGQGVTRALCHAGAVTYFTHTGKSQYATRVSNFISELRDKGFEVEARVVDALDIRGMKSLAGEIASRHGRIDILVCNVGKNLERDVENVDEKDWHRYIDINLSSAFYGVKAVIPYMLKQRYGRIILIGSSAAYDGGGGAIDYASAKAGLVGMMLYLCRIYTRMGINTNVVHPCIIDTELVRERYSTKEKFEKLKSQIPVGRVGTPEDIGGIVAFLASSWGDYIVGQQILLDGGRTLWRAV